MLRLSTFLFLVFILSACSSSSNDSSDTAVTDDTSQSESSDSESKGDNSNGDDSSSNDTTSHSPTKTVSLELILAASSSAPREDGTIISSDGTDIGKANTGITNGYNSQSIDVSLADGTSETVIISANATAGSIASQFHFIEGVTASSSTRATIPFTSYLNQSDSMKVIVNGVKFQPSGENPSLQLLDLATKINESALVQTQVAINENSGDLVIVYGSGGNLTFGIEGSSEDSFSVLGPNSDSALSLTTSQPQISVGGSIEIKLAVGVSVSNASATTPIFSDFGGTQFSNNAFHPNYSETYNYKTTASIYDNSENEHELQLYFCKIAPEVLGTNTWQLHALIDGEDVGKPITGDTPSRATFNLVFRSDGLLNPTLSDELVISDWIESDEEYTYNLNLDLDIIQMGTEFALGDEVHAPFNNYSQTLGVELDITLPSNAEALYESGKTYNTTGADIGVAQSGSSNGYSSQSIDFDYYTGTTETVTTSVNATAGAIAAQMSLLEGVDATASTTATIPIHSYTNTSATMSITLNGTSFQPSGAATALQLADLGTKINASALVGVMAVIDSATGDLQIIQDQGANLVFGVSGGAADSFQIEGTDTAETAITLDTSNPQATAGGSVYITVGEGITLSNASATTPILSDFRGNSFINNKFNPSDSGTYNHTTSTTIFDSLAMPHTLSLYFVKQKQTSTIPANAWIIYAQVDNQDVGDALIGTAPSRSSYNIVFNEDGSIDEAISDQGLVSNWDPLNEDEDEEPNGAQRPLNVVNGGTLPIPTPASSSNFEIKFGSLQQSGEAFVVLGIVSTPDFSAID